MELVLGGVPDILATHVLFESWKDEYIFQKITRIPILYNVRLLAGSDNYIKIISRI